jgi:hypothetical protein
MSNEGNSAGWYAYGVPVIVRRWTQGKFVEVPGTIVKEEDAPEGDGSKHLHVEYTVELKRTRGGTYRKPKRNVFAYNPNQRGSPRACDVTTVILLAPDHQRRAAFLSGAEGVDSNIGSVEASGEPVDSGAGQYEHEKVQPSFHADMDVWVERSYAPDELMKGRIEAELPQEPRGVRVFKVSYDSIYTNRYGNQNRRRMVKAFNWDQRSGSVPISKNFYETLTLKPVTTPIVEKTAVVEAPKSPASWRSFKIGDRAILSKLETEDGVPVAGELIDPEDTQVMNAYESPRTKTGQVLLKLILERYQINRLPKTDMSLLFTFGEGESSAETERNGYLYVLQPSLKSTAKKKNEERK